MKCIYCNSTKCGQPCYSCGSLNCYDPEIAYDENEYHAYKTSWFRPKIYFLGIKAFKCGLKRGIKVADIGCGAGHALYWAKKMGCATVGWDIESARKTAKHVDSFYSDLTEMSEKEAGSCDVVWCWHTIEHANEPEKLLQAAFKILKANGCLHLEFPDSGLILNRSNWMELCSFPEHRGVPSHRSMYDMLKRIGFNNLKTDKPTEGRWLYLQSGRPLIHSRICASKQPSVCPRCSNKKELMELIYNPKGEQVCGKCGVTFSSYFKPLDTSKESREKFLNGDDAK